MTDGGGTGVPRVVHSGIDASHANDAVPGLTMRWRRRHTGHRQRGGAGDGVGRHVRPAAAQSAAVAEPRAAGAHGGDGRVDVVRVASTLAPPAPPCPASHVSPVWVRGEG